MLSQNLEKPVRPSLEDLLKLKRFEKPEAAFWNDFERQLEAKRLTILLKKEPWALRCLKSFLGRRFRLSSALGVAALALVVSIRQGNFTPQAALDLAEASSSFAKKDLHLSWIKASQLAFSQNIMVGAQKSLQVASVALPCKTHACYMNGGALPLTQPTARQYASF